jgi:hypothetical protein
VTIEPKLLDIFNNYLRLRSTTTPTGKLHGAISNIIFCFNYSLPLMMLKNKQTNCLFVNFKKEIKTKGIRNICF